MADLVTFEKQVTRASKVTVEVYVVNPRRLYGEPTEYGVRVCRTWSKKKMKTVSCHFGEKSGEMAKKILAEVLGLKTRGCANPTNVVVYSVDGPGTGKVGCNDCEWCRLTFFGERDSGVLAVLADAIQDDDKWGVQDASLLWFMENLRLAGGVKPVEVRAG